MILMWSGKADTSRAVGCHLLSAQKQHEAGTGEQGNSRCSMIQITARGCNVMWSTVHTLCPIPCGGKLDVTVLLDSWKIAFSFGCWTFKPADLVNLSVKLCTGAVPERQGSTAGGFRASLVSGVHSTHGDIVKMHLALFVPSLGAPRALHTLLPFPSRCSEDACWCFMDMR